MVFGNIFVKADSHPNRSMEFDALPGFANPPAGYGEVPFWWWSGGDLDLERLLWQIRELHAKGISGVQVNYSHTDAPGWGTDAGEPAIFSEAWWEIFSSVSEECGKLGMGIGLSTYTLDWPMGGKNLFKQLFYDKPEWNALEIRVAGRHPIVDGEKIRLPVAETPIAIRAYPVVNGTVWAGGVDLAGFVKNGCLEWTAPDGAWSVWIFIAERLPGTWNPLLPGSGARIVRDFYQAFEDRNPGKTSKGLNYFFNDELQIGAGKFAWSDDFPDEFRQRKGYDLFEVLPALWTDIGDPTPKVLMDYADVRMALMEERYFQPIHDWHATRGILFGCDTAGRGTRPDEFGDYFRATRWYTAPGHDTPGGNADLIKGKVSSSIANLYQKPRVWLEGYHSLGWGATPERLMQATRENFLYGCTLLNLHGLYYTTHGSFWEWAPPCYHFRMPYWEHMGVFLKYFERLSFLMSQGHTVCDVAVVYPVAPFEAEMGGDEATKAAFELAAQLVTGGIDFEFLDHQTLEGAEVEDGRLVVQRAGAAYKVLVFPAMGAVRWGSIAKAAEFRRSGGLVLSLGCLPTASDRAGRNDPELRRLLDEAIPAAHQFDDAPAAFEKIRNAFVQDVRSLGGTVRYLHRKVGPREVYLTMDAAPGEIVEFRAKGAVELWDPWTGKNAPLRVVRETETGTQVEMPLEKYEAQVVVFTPGIEHRQPAKPLQKPSVSKVLPDDGWQVEFFPTMDNRWGDFRLPVDSSHPMIGVEARQFLWAPEGVADPQTAHQPEIDERGWTTQLHGHGAKFYRLGPIPEDAEISSLAAKLAELTELDPTIPVWHGGQSYAWEPCEFSWRSGDKENPGHQGFHGNKGQVGDNFLHIGKPTPVPYGLDVLQAYEEGKTHHVFLWTRAVAEAALRATLETSQPDESNAGYASVLTSPVTTPASLFINGKNISSDAKFVDLQEGPNPVLLRFDSHGEAHFALRKADSPRPEREPLSMRWHKDEGLIPLDPAAPSTQWFRFVSAPGTCAISIPVALSTSPVQAWMDGKPLRDAGGGRFVAESPATDAPLIALAMSPPAGARGGAALPEPIRVETSGRGTLPLGDWSKVGILHNFSGGVAYSKSLDLTAAEAGEITHIDLGKVIATAGLRVNGEDAGVRVAPPWKFDVAGLLKAGPNTITVTVFNTLSNHYQTIPNNYRGDPDSGLFGPVRMLREI